MMGPPPPKSGKAPVKKGYEKLVPEARKYSHIGPRLSTGPTQNKVKYLTNNQVLRRRDEIFLRISKEELAELFEEYEKYDEHLESNIIHGTDETEPRVCVHDTEAEVAYDRPYLVLDVRTPEEFESCHILHARSMPQRHLMQDKMHAELYSFKNLQGKLIVVYDRGERLAAAAAHQLVHRGFSNVFVLSRGILSFAESFPLYVEGDAEALLKERQASSSVSRNRRGPPSVSTSHRKKKSGDEDDTDSISTRVSEVSVADTVISRATIRKARL